MAKSEGDHCTFINPLCPSDLCTLKYRHQGDHELNTGIVVKRKPGHQAPRGTSVTDLMQLGARRAYAMGLK